MKNLDLTAIRYFTEAARCGSIRQAAERLHVTPSAVSKQIAKLEAMLQATLIERHADGIRLTAAGALMQKEAECLQEIMVQLQRRMSNLVGQHQERVHFAAADAACGPWLYAILAHFNKAYPHFHCRMSAGRSAQVMAQLLSTEAAIGIVMGVACPPEVRVLERLPVEMVLVAGAGHALSYATALTPEQLKRQQLVALEGNHGTFEQVTKVLKLSHTAYDTAYIAQSLHAARDLVMANMGVAMFPEFFVRDDIRMGRLKVLPVQGVEPLSVDMALCVRKGSAQTAAGQALLALLQERFGTLAAPPVWKAVA